MNEKLEYIQKLTFFSLLDQENIQKLLDISKVVHYPKNSILFYENDSASKILFLISGLIKIYKIDKFGNEIFLYHIHKNSMISELTSLQEDTIYCYSNSEFMEDSVVLEIDFLAFKEQFLSKNILNSEFINEILSKVMQLHCVVNRELVFDATAKVAFMLIDDLDMFNTQKRHEVSFMLHIQPETLSRVLNKLKREAIIEIENSVVTILDKQKLIKIYKGE